VRPEITYTGLTASPLGCADAASRRREHTIRSLVRRRGPRECQYRITVTDNDVPTGYTVCRVPRSALVPVVSGTGQSGMVGSYHSGSADERPVGSLSPEPVTYIKESLQRSL